MSENEKKAKRSKKVKTNGTVGLFDPMTLRGVTVRNRIWTRIPRWPRMACPRHSTTSIMCRVPWAVSA